MATKVTKKPFNKKVIANRLDTIVNNINRKGVYVIKQNDCRLYDVVNYFNGTIQLADLPTKDLANTACDKYNAGKRYTANKYRLLMQALAHYRRLNTDCIYYTYHMFQGNTYDIRVLSEIRKDAAEARMKEILQEIKRLV